VTSFTRITSYLSFDFITVLHCMSYDDVSSIDLPVRLADPALLLLLHASIKRDVTYIGTLQYKTAKRRIRLGNSDTYEIRDVEIHRTFLQTQGYSFSPMQCDLNLLCRRPHVDVSVLLHPVSNT
jgi:hypothetical protein